MKLGKTGMDVSRMGLGTWSIGGGSAWGGDHDLQTVVDTIVEAPKLGVNLIDTAPGYNFGNSEKILGMALQKMNREDVDTILNLMPNKRYGKLIRLRYLDMKSNEETAEALGMNMDNYYNVHKRAKSQYERVCRKEDYYG